MSKSKLEILEQNNGELFCSILDKKTWCIECGEIGKPTYFHVTDCRRGLRLAPDELIEAIWESGIELGLISDDGEAVDRHIRCIRCANQAIATLWIKYHVGLVLAAEPVCEFHTDPKSSRDYAPGREWGVSFKFVTDSISVVQARLNLEQEAI